MQTNFNKCLELLLEHEGGYVNHPDDPGGHTNKGITLTTFRKHYGSAKTVDDLKAITDEQVRHIYKVGYWDVIQGDDAPAGVDWVLFDMAVNAGPFRAKELERECANVWGGYWIGDHLSIEKFIGKFTLTRQNYYKTRRSFKTFGKGWMARAGRTMDQALEMAREEWRRANPG